MGGVLYLTGGIKTFQSKIAPGLVVLVGQRRNVAYVFHPASRMVLDAPFKILRNIKDKDELEARRIQKRHERSIQALIEQQEKKSKEREEEEEKIEDLKASFRSGLFVLARGKDKKKARGGKAAFLSGARVDFVAPDGSTHRSHLLDIHLSEEPPDFWTPEAEEATRDVYQELIRDNEAVEALDEYINKAGEKARVEVIAENKPGVPVGAVCDLVKVSFRNATVFHNGRRRILSPLAVKPKP